MNDNLLTFDDGGFGIFTVASLILAIVSSCLSLISLDWTEKINDFSYSYSQQKIQIKRVDTAEEWHSCNYHQNADEFYLEN